MSVSTDPVVSISIDRDLCFGVGDCVETVPAVFKLDDEQKAVVIDPSAAPLDDILEAAHNCPVEAIFVTDQSGVQLYP